jgi:hypothetical protein
MMKMYKFKSGQMQLTDFGMPSGMELDPNNRWVQKAEIIPWEAIELQYSKLFKSNTGNVAKPLRLALGALLIQTERSISDEEVTLQIQETPCLQYFCGFSGFTNEKPFDSSLLVHFRKRLTKDVLNEINELIIAKATNSKESESSDDDTPTPPTSSFVDENEQTPTNKGDLIIDATCAPQNIRYPQDLSLLNEARVNLETMIDKLHRPSSCTKPRTYRKIARSEYLKAILKKRKTEDELRDAIDKQLRYVFRNLNIVHEYLDNGETLSKKLTKRLSTICEFYNQQVYMYDNRTHSVNDRIVSLSQPWVRPIVRGKAKAKCEFGAKLDISVTDGFSRLETTSFDAYNESENLVTIVERYKQRTGCYPERVLVDSIYRTRNNIMFCKKRNIRISGKPLGRPKKEDAFDKKQQRQDETDRIEVERKFSHAKGSFGLGLIRARLENTSLTAISLSIISLNIAYIGRCFLHKFFKVRIFCYKLKIISQKKLFDFHYVFWFGKKVLVQ